MMEYKKLKVYYWIWYLVSIFLPSLLVLTDVVLENLGIEYYIAGDYTYFVIILSFVSCLSIIIYMPIKILQKMLFIFYTALILIFQIIILFFILFKAR